MTDPKSGAIVATIMSVLRSLGVMASGVGLILATLHKGDVNALYALVQSDALVPAISAAVAVGLMGYGAWKRWQGHVAQKKIEAITAPQDKDASEKAARMKAEAGV